MPYGLSCHVVNDAQVAVDTLKQGLAALQPWTTVVVGQHLPDMTGPAFVDGLVRHFDPANVVLLADVEPQIAQLLSSMPKVALFPSGTDGVVVADHLFKRLGGAPLSLSTTPAPSSSSSSSSPPASLASLFDAPRTGMTVPLQQQTPAQAFAMPSPGASSWGPPQASQPPSASSWGAPQPSQPPSASSWGPPQPSQPPRPTTMPFFQALSASAPTAMPVASSMPSMPPSMAQAMPPSMPTGPDRATLARIEAMASEIASVNAELVTTRARLQAAEQRVAETAHQAFEREAESSGLRADVRELQTELDMVRQAVASDVAEISALADDGVAAQTELENLRMELQGALTDRDGAVGQLEMVRAERDQLTASLDGARRELSVAHADIEQQRAVVDSLEGTVRAAEQSTAELQAALALATEQQLANDDARRTAELVAAELAMTQGQRAELEAALAAGTERMVLLQGQLAELEAARENLASESEAALQTVKAQLATERDRVIASESERQQLLSELEAAHTALGEAAGVRAELDIVSAEKLESENAWAQEQQKVADLEARLGESQAAHLDSETRLQGELSALQQKVAELEAVAAVVVEVQGQLKEAERHAALEEARADRAVADATGMRQYIEAQTHEQARIVGEIEQLRPIASEVDRARAAMVDMQRQLEAALGTDEHDGSTEGAIEEGARARTRELLELARAIEPFVWGLDQAAGFFAEANVDGATRHIQAMRLLQKTLERLKNELDRLHQT